MHQQLANVDFILHNTYTRYVGCFLFVNARYFHEVHEVHQQLANVHLTLHNVCAVSFCEGQIFLQKEVQQLVNVHLILHNVCAVSLREGQILGQKEVQQQLMSRLTLYTQYRIL